MPEMGLKQKGLQTKILTDTNLHSEKLYVKKKVLTGHAERRHDKKKGR